MEELQSRVALITGAASGIGLACARLFAREGMKLVLADIDRVALESAVAALCATGAEAIGVPTDVGDRAALHTLAETTWGRFGGAHIVFNNAGVAAYGAATELTQADWEWSLQINLWSAIYGVETFLPRLLAQNLPAHILFTSSFAGLVVSKNMTSYNVAKAAVVALAESLAKDLYKSSIGVSVLCPMRVATNVWETSPRSRPAALGGAQAFRRRPPEVTAGMAGEILDVDYVAERVLDGVRKKTLYIVPHQEARPIIRRKFDKLDASFNV